ncbi:phage tail spike protein [Thermoactinomyces sp. DSM 45892]|uniref:phage tail spike protein n=1 Tax=Thermoactinomyces sp. DSM 45892 TaxID=1882753 RepID=UPI0015A48988|nr:phage tail spike protein [Thermoactinomyces sp. DSM 45892]
MFVDIDYSKKPKDIRLHLSKPNKQVISHISEKWNVNLSLKLGNISELSFSIPYKVANRHNSHVELIKEKMLIKVTMEGHIEWFIVDEIEEDSDDSDTFHVKAFSLGYELQHKRISVQEDSINAHELLTKLVANTIWTIDSVDPIFHSIYRQFDLSDTNVLDGILQLGETFQALIKWDTTQRKISLHSFTTYGKFRGTTIDYGRFLRSIKRTRTTDELVTRLYVYGNEGTSIHSINPTGQSYIEDFSYFLYPFERDKDRKIIKSSHFMSDDLCHALLDHQELVNQNSPQIKTLSNHKNPKETQLVTEESKLAQLHLELTNILQLLDLAKATEDTNLIKQRIEERNLKEAQITSQTTIVFNLKNEISHLNSQIQTLQDQISNDPQFTSVLKKELDPYIIEKEWRDERYTNPQELYDDGLKKFNEMRIPKVVIEANVENLIDVAQLQLGDLIKTKYRPMNIEYMARFIEIQIDFESHDTKLIISNTQDLLDESEKLVQLLYSTSATSSLVEANKHIWNQIQPAVEQVNSILSNQWEANKNKIVAGVNNQVEIGNRGIVIRNPDTPEEIVIAQAGIIALSKDNGETWKTAIKPDGVVAERLIGKVVAGENLLITNGNGHFVFDNRGARIKADSFVIESGTGSNLIQDWTNSLNHLEFKLQDDQIASIVTRNEPFLTSLDSKLRNHDFQNDLLYWKEDHKLSTPLKAPIISGQGKYGDKVVQISGSKTVFYGKMIPIDPSRTYRVQFRVRQTKDSSVSEKSKVFAGVASFDVAKQPITTVHYGEHRYCAVQGQNLTVADGWQEFNGIITGEGVDSYNQFIQGTKYAVPVFVVNHDDGDGVAEVDSCSLDDITLESNMDGLSTRISNAEERITDDSIVNTVTQSISYQNDLDSKASFDDLSRYTTSEALEKSKTEANSYTDNQIRNIDFSPYVTQSKLEQKADSITAKFASSGGVNLLKNSVGYAGIDFWTIHSQNMLPNSSLQNGTTHYSLSTGWSLDNMMQYKGFNTLICDVTSLTTNEMRAVTTPFGNVRAGETFSGSWFVNIPSTHNIDMGAKVEMEWYDAESKLSSITTNVNLSMINRWQRIVAKGTAPNGATRVRVKIYPVQNGSFWATLPQLEKGNLTEWSPNSSDPAIGKLIKVIQNDEVKTKGSGSGFSLSTGGKMVQSIIPIEGASYSISAMCKSLNGNGYIRLYDGDVTSTQYAEILLNGSHNYSAQHITLKPTTNKVTVELCCSYHQILFTSIMLNIGEIPLQWQHASGEVYNTHIRMDVNGLRVSHSDYSGYTTMTPEKFAGYYDVNQDGLIDESLGSTDEVFRMDRDEFVMKKANVKQEILLGSIKLMKIHSGDKNGWAFVATG